VRYRRKQPGAFYAYPEHVRGLRGKWKRLLWRLGFDPLTVRERLVQVRREADDWKRWGDEFANAVVVLWGDHRDEIRAEIERTRAAAHSGGEPTNG